MGALRRGMGSGRATSAGWRGAAVVAVGLGGLGTLLISWLAGTLEVRARDYCWGCGSTAMLLSISRMAVLCGVLEGPVAILAIV